MIQKIVFLIILQIYLLVNNSYAQTAEEYHKAYKSSFEDALTFLKNNKAKFNSEFSKHQVDVATMVSAVFPEIVRYSEVSNLMETASLEILYVRFGAYYADFSVGRFQMKPSFIEKIEDYVEKNQIKEINYLSIYQTIDEKEIRAERVKRLRDIIWQIRYLAGFYKIIIHKFGSQLGNQEDKIRFFASAYNRGFEQNKEEILKWTKIKAFPYGPKYKGTQYAYTDISIYFFQKFFKSIFND